MKGLLLLILAEKQIPHIPGRGKQHNRQGAEKAGKEQNLYQVNTNVTEQAHARILQQAAPLRTHLI